MLKPEDMKRQRDLFISDYMDITNNGGIAATDAKADYIELKNDPKMVDEKVMQAAKTKVFNYFGVNESIIKSDYSEDQWNAFYESTIEPIAIQLSLEFTSKLFTSKEQGYGNEIIFESNRLQYASNKTKVEVVTMLVDRGMMSLNQGLEVFNLPPIEGGEKRIVSLNFVDSELANQYQLGLKKNEGQSDGNQ
jgi:phage portal protein BeeE